MKNNSLRALVFQIRLTKEERRLLDELAAHEWLPASSVIRRLIRDAHARVCVPKAARPVSSKAISVRLNGNAETGIDRKELASKIRAQVRRATRE